MGRNLETHPLIDKLAPDLDNPPDLVRLVGYLGPASREGHCRIYHDPDLHSYTEVARDAIAHTEPVDPGNENSPTIFLTRAGARAHSVVSRSHDLGSGYLSGGITDAHLAGAATPPHGSGALPTTSNPPICW